MRQLQTSIQLSPQLAELVTALEIAPHEPISIISTDDLTNLLRRIAGLLRTDGGPENSVGRCFYCAYQGPFGTSECACYDEYAVFCRPNSPGPGCPNGTAYCPVCQEGNEPPQPNNVAEALMEIEKLLNVRQVLDGDYIRGEADGRTRAARADVRTPSYVLGYHQGSRAAQCSQADTKEE